MGKQLLQDTAFLRFSIEESAEGGKLVARGEFARADVPTANKRIYPAKLWKRELNKLSEAINKRRVLGELDHPCFIDNDFDVLTSEGWKPFSEVKVGSQVWSRVEHKAVLSEVTGITDQDYCGPAYFVHGRTFQAGFTPAHKFILVNRPESKNEQIQATLQEIVESPKSFGHSAIPKTAIWEYRGLDEFVIPGIPNASQRFKYDMRNDLVIDSKVFAAFMGIYLSEGNCSSDTTDTYGVFISQKTEWTKAMIQSDILDKFPHDIEWTENSTGFYTADARLYSYLKKLGTCYDKYIPAEVKNLGPDALHELLYWFCIGDGRFVHANKKQESEQTFKQEFCESILTGAKRTRTDMFSVSKTLIDDLHECLVKTGKAGSVSVIVPTDDYLYAGRLIKSENKKPLYQLHVCGAKNVWMDPRFLKIDEILHDGRIFCLSVTHGNFYVRKNGNTFWTGNSDGKTKLQRVSHVITNLQMNEDGQIIGELEVIDTPNGKTLAAIRNANCEIGVSSRGYGSVKVNEEGYDVVQEDFGLMTFDAVSDPAVTSSYPDFSMEQKDKRDDQMILKESAIADAKKMMLDYKIPFEDIIQRGKEIVVTFVKETLAKKFAKLFDLYGGDSVSVEPENDLWLVKGTAPVEESLAQVCEAWGEDTDDGECVEQAPQDVASRQAHIASMKAEVDKAKKESPQDAKELERSMNDLSKKWGVDPKLVTPKQEVVEAEPGIDTPPEGDENPEAPEGALEPEMPPVGDKPVSDALSDDVGDFWVLTKGTPQSQEPNILFKTNIPKMVTQGSKGLAPEDVVAIAKKADSLKDGAKRILASLHSGSEEYLASRFTQKADLPIPASDEPEADTSPSEPLEPAIPEEQPEQRQIALEWAVDQVTPILKEKLIGEFEEAYQQKVAGILDENRKLKEENFGLGAISKDLGFSLFLERNCSKHPRFQQIKESLKGFKHVESIEELKTICAPYIEESKELERQESVSNKMKVQKFEERVEELQERIQGLVGENKRLTEDAMKMSNLMEGYEHRMYLDKKLVGNPNAVQIRTLFESRNPTSREEVNTIVGAYRQKVENGPSLIEAVQSSLKRRRLPTNNLVESSLRPTLPKKKPQVVPGTDLPIEDFDKLSGITP